MKKYCYICNIGCLRIIADSGTLFYENHFGDGIFDVFICKKAEIPKIAQFQGCFTVAKEGWLMLSDCGEDDLEDPQEQHKFGRGNYSVYLNHKTFTFYICKARGEKQ